MPKSHNLSKRKIIHLNDLNNQTLMIMKSGDSTANELLRKAIQKQSPTAKIVDAPYFYDLETFNEAEQEGNILITLDCWKDLHPSLVTIPIECEYKVPYGILYSKKPRKEILEFLKIIKEEYNKKNEPV